MSLIAITGASAGIGASIARRFDINGNKIVLLARRKQKLEELKAQLHNSEVFIYELDVSSRKRVEMVFDLIEKEHGSIDILVNNAGLAFGLDKAQDSKLDDWEKCVDVNIKGVLYCTHSVLAKMVKRNHGHIVNLGSVAGKYAYPGGNVYCATKAFIHQFSQCLIADLVSTKVRVSCIEPGLVGETEFSKVRFHGDEAKAKSIYERTTPLRPEDVAETIYFCCNAPEHVNINNIEVMPVCQGFSPLAVFRN